MAGSSWRAGCSLAAARGSACGGCSQALEALEGAERCDKYMFVEQHTEWEMEKKRLQREAERRMRHARVRAATAAAPKPCAVPELDAHGYVKFSSVTT